MLGFTVCGISTVTCNFCMLLSQRFYIFYAMILISFAGIRCVVLRSRISQFWRNQKNSPRWYLATIEAIHQFLVELHTCAFGIVENYVDLEDSTVNEEQNFVIPNEESSDTYLTIDLRYNGQYDNLLYLFKYMYTKIHCLYDHGRLLAYRRPLL